MDLALYKINIIVIIIVRLLMRHGADATSKNSSKHPPRDLVANGNQEVRHEMYFLTMIHDFLFRSTLSCLILTVPNGRS